ncbi:hypothetical protein LUZ60_000058 [Juncus effusus]|nr:hypothetical protein LUZ60_000058 [Juncus effusus]
MKASIKFRDDQKPLLRAKVPISILGLPFISGVSTGDAKELRLDLASAFDSGPSFRVSYKPNDPAAPFSLVIKSGIGPFGSPTRAPFAMSAEFNLIGRGDNLRSSPGFLILLKPRFGDFVLKKSVKSNSVESVVKKIGTEVESNGQNSVSNGSIGTTSIGLGPFEKVNGFPTDVAMSTKGGIDRFLSGIELNARSVLPVFNRANLNFRWGFRVPAEFNSGVSVSKMPLLVVNKLSIEHVTGDKKEMEMKEKKKQDDDVADRFAGVKPEIDALRAESGLVRRAVEDLRAEVSGWKFASVADVSRGFGSAADVSRGRAQPAKDRKNNGKVPEASKDDVEEAIRNEIARNKIMIEKM